MSRLLPRSSVEEMRGRVGLDNLEAKQTRWFTIYESLRDPPPYPQLNSPRSLAACQTAGVDPVVDLIQISPRESLRRVLGDANATKASSTTDAPTRNLAVRFFQSHSLCMGTLGEKILAYQQYQAHESRRRAALSRAMEADVRNALGMASGSVSSRTSTGRDSSSAPASAAPTGAGSTPAARVSSCTSSRGPHGVSTVGPGGVGGPGTASSSSSVVSVDVSSIQRPGRSSFVSSSSSSSPADTSHLRDLLRQGSHSWIKGVERAADHPVLAPDQTQSKDRRLASQQGENSRNTTMSSFRLPQRRRVYVRASDDIQQRRSGTMNSRESHPADPSPSPPSHTTSQTEKEVVPPVQSEAVGSQRRDEKKFSSSQSPPTSPVINAPGVLPTPTAHAHAIVKGTEGMVKSSFQRGADCRLGGPEKAPSMSVGRIKQERPAATPEVSQSEDKNVCDQYVAETSSVMSFSSSSSSLPPSAIGGPARRSSCDARERLSKPPPPQHHDNDCLPTVPSHCRNGVYPQQNVAASTEPKGSRGAPITTDHASLSTASRPAPHHNSTARLNDHLVEKLEHDDHDVNHCARPTTSASVHRTSLCVGGPAGERTKKSMRPSGTPPSMTACGELNLQNDANMTIDVTPLNVATTVTSVTAASGDGSREPISHSSSSTFFVCPEASLSSPSGSPSPSPKQPVVSSSLSLAQAAAALSTGHTSSLAPAHSRNQTEGRNMVSPPSMSARTSQPQFIATNNDNRVLGCTTEEKRSLSSGQPISTTPSAGFPPTPVPPATLPSSPVTDVVIHASSVGTTTPEQEQEPNNQEKGVPAAAVPAATSSSAGRRVSLSVSDQTASPSLPRPQLSSLHTLIDTPARCHNMYESRMLTSQVRPMETTLTTTRTTTQREGTDSSSSSHVLHTTSSPRRATHTPRSSIDGCTMGAVGVVTLSSEGRPTEASEDGSHGKARVIKSTAASSVPLGEMRPDPDVVDEIEVTYDDVVSPSNGEERVRRTTETSPKGIGALVKQNCATRKPQDEGDESVQIVLQQGRREQGHHVKYFTENNGAHAVSTSETDRVLRRDGLMASAVSPSTAAAASSSVRRSVSLLSVPAVSVNVLNPGSMVNEKKGSPRKLGHADPILSVISDGGNTISPRLWYREPISASRMSSGGSGNENGPGGVGGGTEIARKPRSDARTPSSDTPQDRPQATTTSSATTDRFHAVAAAATVRDDSFELLKRSEVHRSTHLFFYPPALTSKENEDGVYYYCANAV